MRTTVRLDDSILKEAKKLAADTGRSLTAVIEDALREIVNRRKVPVRKARISFPVDKGRGLRRGIDLDSSAELLNVMDDMV
ncbi:MAG: CopG family transcriptional regulator [Acidobacteriaceae bacterium]|nr:CopG family transcriptional regulator [Acidobacteriaceae bacterium]MBV9780971.1 CopG family transcriptional regulator [Acidobacteriaceae bacterium]